MNYLGETTEIKIEESGGGTGAVSVGPVACVMQNVNPLNVALFGSAIPGNDLHFRPFLANVAFDLPLVWPDYFSRQKTPNIACFSNNATNVGIDLAGFYRVDGSVTLIADQDCLLTFTYNTYSPGDSLDDWLPSEDGADQQLCVMGTKTQFNFTSLGNFDATKVFELTIQNGSPVNLSLSVFKYRLSLTKL